MCVCVCVCVRTYCNNVLRRFSCPRLLGRCWSPPGIRRKRRTQSKVNTSWKLPREWSLRRGTGNKPWRPTSFPSCSQRTRAGIFGRTCDRIRLRMFPAGTRCMRRFRLRPSIARCHIEDTPCFPSPPRTGPLHTQGSSPAPQRLCIGPRCNPRSSWWLPSTVHGRTADTPCFLSPLRTGPLHTRCSSLAPQRPCIRPRCSPRSSRNRPVCAFPRGMRRTWTA